ncbi:MAG: zinc ribbon domain-containing protein [Deltaproteobacteria bacterium]|nr:MAG: zinc ribbon domain-containing protein [Deltaproteobacteria bacterium]
MPIYEYRCLACGETSEIFQGIGDSSDPLQCKHCGSKDLERVLSPTSFTFKGAPEQGEGLRCCDRGVSCDNPKRCCEK